MRYCGAEPVIQFLVREQTLNRHSIGASANSKCIPNGAKAIDKSLSTINLALGLILMFDRNPVYENYYIFMLYEYSLMFKI